MSVPDRLRRRAVRCPTCRAEVARGVSSFFPFCSERCRLLDLGNWLDGSYRIPDAPVAPPGGAVDEEESPDGGAGE